MYRKAKEKKEDNLKTRVKLSGVDNYWKNLIRLIIYGFYREKIAPTLESHHAKLIEIPKDRD